MIDRKFGYAAELERREEIDERGIDAEVMLTAMKAAYPTHNPFAEPWNVLTDQGGQGIDIGRNQFLQFTIP